MAKILLVEDDNNLREIYEARLKAEGYDIASASNGEEALVVAKKELPDLVIADVMMPRISGFEMLDILRNTQGLEHVKVIMLTALGQAEDKTRADQLGADRYLVKSQVTLEDIVKAASDLLEGSEKPAAPAAATANPSPQPSANAGNAATQPSDTAQPEPAQQLQPQLEPTQPVPSPSAPPRQPATPAPAAPPPIPKLDVTAPPPEPAQTQTTAPAPQPTQESSAQNNTAQLNNAVNDLINNTNVGNHKAQPTPAPTQSAPSAQPPQPTASTQTPPASDQTDSDSVTLSGKRTIRPLSPDGPEKPHINDLLAREEASSASQLGTAPTPQQLPATPHPAGHVFSPTTQPPQSSPPEAPNDPNKIAL